MMKVFYCKDCKRISYLSQESRAACRACDSKLLLIDIPFNTFTLLDKSKREEVIEENLR